MIQLKKSPGRPKAVIGKKKNIKLTVYLTEKEILEDSAEKDKMNFESLSHMYRHYRKIYFATK